MQQFAAAQGQLGGTLSRLLATVEAYPEVKSQTNFTTLMSQLEGTENRITIAIRDYNGAVQEYNTRIRTFPDRSEEHTSELQSLMRTSYAVFCLKKKTNSQQRTMSPAPSVQS